MLVEDVQKAFEHCQAGECTGCPFTEERLPECSELVTGPIGMAIAKQDRYRWHDLRKDPQDLPETGDRVLVVGSRGGFEIATFRNHPSLGSEFWMRGCKLFNAVAWKYIEPLEVEE